MTGVASGKTLLAAVALAAGLTITTFVGAHFIGSRYESRGYQGMLYVVDRLTGKVQFCDGGKGCNTLALDEALRAKYANGVPEATPRVPIRSRICRRQRPALLTNDLPKPTSSNSLVSELADGPYVLAQASNT